MLRAFFTLSILVASLVCALAAFGRVGTGDPSQNERERRLQEDARAYNLIVSTFALPAPFEIQDEWGTNLKVEEYGELRYTKSAGPDRVFGTHDDYNYSSATPQ